MCINMTVIDEKKRNKCELKKIIVLFSVLILILTGCAAKESSVAEHLNISGVVYSPDTGKLYGLIGSPISDAFDHFGNEFDSDLKGSDASGYLVYKTEDGEQTVNVFYDSASEDPDGNTDFTDAVITKISVTGGKLEITDGIHMGSDLSDVEAFTEREYSVGCPELKVTTEVSDGIYMSYSFDFKKELYHFAVYGGCII